MDNGRVISFFLGSNSADGFHSLYDDFISPDDFFWVIKGGPGCGKSSFMKKIGSAAEASGFEVEYIYCSADPEALDAVYIPDKRLGYMDGTAPHVMDVKYPASGQYLDLGKYYRNEVLGKNGDIQKLNTIYRELYSRAYERLKAASGVFLGWPGLDETLKAAIRRRADSSVQREFGKKSSKGISKRRFISAITCKGYIHMSETAAKLCDRIFAIDNEYGLAPGYLAHISEKASERGIDKIECFDPLIPSELQAVLLPGLRLGYVAHSDLINWRFSVTRHVRLDAMLDAEKLKLSKARLKAAKKLREQLLASAIDLLAESKAIHDEIEQIYNPFVEFSKIYDLSKIGRAHV